MAAATAGEGARRKLAATRRPQALGGLLALVILAAAPGVSPPPAAHALPAAPGPAGAVAARPADPAADLTAARALFEANLDAIRNRDREAYLACYLESERLARTGPTGFVLGYEGLAASAGEGWPEVFEAQDLRLVPVREGVVYGTYRYRVRFDGVEQSGLSERLFVDTGDGWKIAVTTAFPAPPGTPPPPRALVGATLVDGTGGEPVPDAVVVMAEGVVACAGTRAACPVPDGVEAVALDGRWITPGLIDAHVHFSQTGWADGRPDFVDARADHPYAGVMAGLESRPERFLDAWLCSGVTGVFDVGGYPWTWQLRGRAGGRAPRVAASGPLLSTVDFWLNQPGEAQFLHLKDAETAREQVRYLAAHGSDAVKIWFIPDEERDFEEMAEAVRAAGAEAERLGLPLAVHATGLREARVAVDAGARLLVHSIWDQEVDDAFVAAALERGTFYTPTLNVARGYLRFAEAAAAGQAPEVDDPNRCVDAETLAKVRSTAEMDASRFTEEGMEAFRQRVAERERVGAVNLKRLADAGVPVVLGTDAGNPLTLHGPAIYAELEAMQAAGLAPMRVIVAATRDGARAMGHDEKIGTVEAGKAADLLILEADPAEDVAAFRRLVQVVSDGVLRDVEELAARGPR